MAGSLFDGSAPVAALKVQPSNLQNVLFAVNVDGRIK